MHARSAGWLGAMCGLLLLLAAAGCQRGVTMRGSWSIGCDYSEYDSGSCDQAGLRAGQPTKPRHSKRHRRHANSGAGNVQNFPGNFHPVPTRPVFGPPMLGEEPFPPVYDAPLETPPGTPTPADDLPPPEAQNRQAAAEIVVAPRKRPPSRGTAAKCGARCCRR